MNRLIAEWIGTVFNIGKLPLAPGTWSSLIASLTWFFLFDSVSPIILPIITLLLFTIGIISCEKIINDTKEKDPSRIVIDEWVGQWIALWWLELSFLWGLMAFFVFRLFDIWKPWPVNKLDLISHGWGVMLDDVAAGIYTVLVIQTILFILK